MSDAPPGAGSRHAVAWVTDGDTPAGEAIVRRLLIGGFSVAFGSAAAAADVQHPALRVPLATETGAAVAHTAVVDALGPVTALVCTAEVRPVRAAVDSDDDLWTTALETNLLTGVRAARLVVPAMRAARTGRIVAVASTAARRPWPNSTAYAASQGALVAWTHALAAELAPDQVCVNAVLVGETAGGSDPAAAPVRPGPTRMLAEPGTVEDVAAAVAFLASPDASFVTSTILPVESGVLGVAAQ